MKWGDCIKIIKRVCMHNIISWGKNTMACICCWSLMQTLCMSSSIFWLQAINQGQDLSLVLGEVLRDGFYIEQLVQFSNLLYVCRRKWGCWLWGGGCTSGLTLTWGCRRCTDIRYRCWGTWAALPSELGLRAGLSTKHGSNRWLIWAGMASANYCFGPQSVLWARIRRPCFALRSSNNACTLSRLSSDAVGFLRFFVGEEALQFLHQNSCCHLFLHSALFHHTPVHPYP